MRLEIWWVENDRLDDMAFVDKYVLVQHPYGNFTLAPPTMP